jgi:murein DD-endopeptidase MepM/ murein hydrolase activator NlpD
MKLFPFNKMARITEDSNSFESVNYDIETEIPIGNQHVGAFGYVRKNHIHEGVDLYCKEGEDVYAMEEGVVVFIENFTGPNADPPSPWWKHTRAVHIEGESGVIVYGEIIEADEITVGAHIKQGNLIGKVTQVLDKDKGRPMIMLHLELYEHGHRGSVTWNVGETLPVGLKDPTNLLIDAIGNTN